MKACRQVDWFQRAHAWKPEASTDKRMVVTLTQTSAAPVVDTFKPERRKYPLVCMQIPTDLIVKGTKVPIHAPPTDITPGGCYIEMSMTLEFGTHLTVVLGLDSVRVSTRGVVLSRHASFSNGIQFIAMSSNDKSKLTTFLQQVSA
jgi:hypothetical protein